MTNVNKGKIMVDNIILAGVGIAVSYLGYRVIKSYINGQTMKTDQPILLNEPLKNIIKSRLAETAQKFEKEALAYFIFSEANKRGFAYKDIESLQEKYGKQIAIPSLEVMNLFKDINVDYPDIEKIMRRFLEETQYEIVEDQISSRRMFEKTISSKSEMEAKKILDSLK